MQDQGRSLLAAWLNEHSQKSVKLAAQKKATRLQWQAQKAARKAMISLAETIRVEFANDDEVLTMVGLLPQSTSNPQQTTAETAPTPPVDSDAAALAAEGTDSSATPTEGNDSTSTTTSRKPRRKSVSLAAEVARWRLLGTNVGQMSADQQNQLAVAGWPAARVAQALALVEAVAVADNDQQLAVKDYRGQCKLARQCEQDLRDWYRRFGGRARLAIRDQVPQKQSELYVMLGL
jgi:hypothetical protein